MSRAKLFIENFIIYGFGGIISKIIPFIMLPIITHIMPSTEYFGIADLSNTIVSFGSAIAIMGIYDAMYRMFFDNEDINHKKIICSTALAFTAANSLAVFMIMVLFQDVISQYFFGNDQYGVVVCLSAMAILVGATNSIISAPTRMQNKRIIFIIANSVAPFLSYSVSIPLLLAGYYAIALPLAAVISGAIMELSFYVLNKEWFALRKFNFSILRDMLAIALPLMPNFLIYWVFNSCDKVMITNMIGIEAAGIYSLGAKFGHMSQLIYTAFAGGWQYFSFSTMKEKDQVVTNSKIFEYLGVISFFSCAIVCTLSYDIYDFLFPKDYIDAYIIAPYLFLSPLLLMLYQVMCNQFIIIRKTWPSMIIMFVGAIVNIALNFILIPIIGIEGASIATLSGYIVVVSLAITTLRNMKLIVIRGKFVTATIIMTLFLISWRLYLQNTLITVASFMILISMFGCLYWKDIRGWLTKFNNPK